jgi:hypothetical protein
VPWLRSQLSSSTAAAAAQSHRRGRASSGHC